MRPAPRRSELPHSPADRHDRRLLTNAIRTACAVALVVGATSCESAQPARPAGSQVTATQAASLEPVIESWAETSPDVVGAPLPGSPGAVGCGATVLAREPERNRIYTWIVCEARGHEVASVGLPARVDLTAVSAQARVLDFVVPGDTAYDADLHRIFPTWLYQQLVDHSGIDTQRLAEQARSRLQRSS